jgi:acetyl/propionyl-CoA carboxylase alpha subunit/acetyl-CoA carboxylase carboxyltransferase component
VPLEKLLIANRGEIAVRIARAAAELGIATVAVYTPDDAASLHVRRADDAEPLERGGVAGYLDGDAIVRVARERGCDAVHPGYGFLSENAAFARACAAAGLTFAGPAPETLELFGDKAAARAFARSVAGDEVLLGGTDAAATLDDVRAFFAAERAAGGSGIVIKALAGGGGRGMRVVRDEADLDDAYARCRSEARSAFGDDGVYVERELADARHIEVQIAGDGAGGVIVAGDRECTLQRRRQKLVEIAPAPALAPHVRERLHACARLLAERTSFRNLGTFEFLVPASGEGAFAFIECNPRLQVEHTVTEAVSGVDLVRLQLQLAGGASFASLGLRAGEALAPRGFAIEVRVNAETMTAAGDAIPASGTLERFAVPGGPGVRIDTCAYAGYALNPHFDSLLAKSITYSANDDVPAAFARARRALAEFDITGVPTNAAFLARLLADPAVTASRATTRFIDEHASAFVRDGDAEPIAPANDGAGDDGGATVVRAPMPGRVVSIDVAEGDAVPAGATVAILDAMKMEHVIVAPAAGIVLRVAARANEVVAAGATLVALAPADVASERANDAAAVDPDHVRPDLAEALARRAKTADAARPDAVAKRHASGGRTARENVADLCDPGTFSEYGGLAVPAQRRRRPLAELIDRYPADGFVCGFGDVNGALFDASRTRCMVLAYDYTVFAGTQGMMNHKKTDRMLELAERHRLPIVLFAEGGGGRPGDTDALGVAGLDVMTFAKYARLSGTLPRVGIVNGRCFAGNAALLGCSDAIVATRSATIGMGGPAMIEGGGLGVYAPEEVGPIDVQTANGVVDVAVRDEAEAVAVAKRYLSYFQGDLADWTCADQRLLRGVVPENRLRVYDVRRALDVLADTDSVLELRRAFAPGIVTALARVEGKPLGVIANDPAHLAGAIDSDGADKAARFMQLCDAFGLPLLFLCDTPGIMVGPDAERTALVRHASRLFANAAKLRVPFFTIVLRKGYGLGAQAMAGGSFRAGSFTIAWPTGEFGAMGIEGAVRLGYRNELAAVADPGERRALFERMVAQAYADGKALNMASFLEIDEVIDPAESRAWIRSGLRFRDAPGAREGSPPVRFVDTW